MITFYITLNSMEQLINLTNQLNKLDFSIDAYAGHFVLNAKSILGMLSIGIGKRIMLKAHTEDDSFLRTGLTQFIVSPFDIAG